MKPFQPLQYILIFFLAVSALPLNAAPPSPSQWYHINTPHVNLIFRGGINQEAQRIANTLDHLYGPVSQSLGAQPVSIPLILWDQKFTSNGSFALPPRRIDLYNGAPQNYNFTGTNDWFSLLAIHEFRHVVQYAKLNQNFNKLFYWLGGEMALAGITGALVPAWFLEGDAVGIETALSKSGRGRIPHFSRLYKANLLERGGFSYCKQVFQSFNHEVPNHYRVGYYLTTHLRRNYGADILGDILEKTTWPMLFPIAVKKATGKSLRQVYKDTNEELRGLWQKQLDELKLTPATSIMARADETYTDYSYPQLDEAGNLIVLKEGLGTAAQFVMLDEDGKEQPLFVPGKVHKEISFSAAQDQIVWTESVPHPRWHDYRSKVLQLQSDRHYGVIQRYDLRKRCLKRLTHRGRYGTAALSPDATKIVAVESDTHYQHRLVTLDATDGKVLHRLPNPDNYFYLTPRWLANGRLVVAVKHHQQKATLTLVDTLTGESQDLLPYSEENIGAPVPYGKYIFYNSAYNGIDNIYALDLESHQRYQVTSRKYGAYNPTISADGRWIIFNDFTKDGMDVAKMPFAPQEWTPLEEVEDKSIHYYAPLVEQEGNADVLDHIPGKTYPVAPYHPGKQLLNIHSWPWPLTPQESRQPIGPLGFMIQSNDLLHTTELKGGYLYDLGKSLGETFAKLTYKGWYPVTTLEGHLYKSHKTGGTAREAGLTFQLPLKFKQGQYTNNFSLSTTSSLLSSAQVIQFAQTYKGQVSREAKKSTRDLYSPWRQELVVSYMHTPYRKERTRDTHLQILTVQSEFRFPGLFKHHSLSLSPQYERSIYALSPPPPMVVIHPHTNTLSPPINTYAVTASYEWPIAYPDWSLGDLFYVKRLRGQLIYHPKYQPAEKKKYHYQVGLGATMDVGFSFLNIPLRIGGIVVYDKEKGFWPLPILTLSQ